MTGPLKGAAQTDLERLLAELVSSDRSKRLAAIRRVNHAHQRPDLATVDALLEISYQLWRLAEAYEIVNGVEARRTAAWRASEVQRRAKELQREAQAKAENERLRQKFEAEDAEMDKLLDYLSTRVFSLVRFRPGNCHSMGDVLKLNGVEMPGFGRVAFGEVVTALVQIGVPIGEIEESNLWRTAGPEWREQALDQLDRLTRTTTQQERSGGLEIEATGMKP